MPTIILINKKSYGNVEKILNKNLCEINSRKNWNFMKLKPLLKQNQNYYYYYFNWKLFS